MLSAIRKPPPILAPVHPSRIGCEVRAGDMVMRADLRAAKAAKEALGLTGRGPVGGIGFAL
jgi:hypothetical protein